MTETDKLLQVLPRRSAAVMLLLIPMLLGQGCSTTSSTNPRTVPVEDRSSAEAADSYLDEEKHESPELPSAAAAVRESSPAVLALLDSASRDAGAGRRESAAVTLERALRLEPKNPLLWYRLASLRLQLGDWQQAVTLAAKSNSLAAGDPQLQARNWRVIEAAREKTGDASGAEQARVMVRRLESGN